MYAFIEYIVSNHTEIVLEQIISARGRFHFTPDIHLSDDGDAEYTDQHYQQAWVPLHNNQRNVSRDHPSLLFYICPNAYCSACITCEAALVRPRRRAPEFYRRRWPNLSVNIEY